MQSRHLVEMQSRHLGFGSAVILDVELYSVSLQLLRVLIKQFMLLFTTPTSKKKSDCPQFAFHCSLRMFCFTACWWSQWDIASARQLFFSKWHVCRNCKMLLVYCYIVSFPTCRLAILPVFVNRQSITILTPHFSRIAWAFPYEERWHDWRVQSIARRAGPVVYFFR